jgi:hypothetical protein
MADAHEDVAQEMDVDLVLAFDDLQQIPTIDQYALLDLPASNLFDAVVAEATREFDRFASLSHEEIEQMMLEELMKH